MIYGLCLVYPKELAVLPLPRDEVDIATGSALRWPRAPLLAVSSIVRAEAALVFYGKNKWILSGMEPRISLPALFISNVTHVSLRFDWDVANPAELGRISQNLFTGKNDSLTHAARTTAIHEERKQHLRVIWDDMCATLNYPYPRLVLLELDFTRCYCPSGCCRMVSDVMNYTTDWIPGQYSSKQTISVATGLINEAELAYVHFLGKKCKECVNVPWKDRMTLEKKYCREPFIVHFE